MSTAIAPRPVQRIGHAARAAASATGRQVAQVAACSSGLGWVALAHDERRLLATSFGYSSRQQAVQAVRRKVASPGSSMLPDERPGRSESPEWVGDLLARLVQYADGESIDFSDVSIDQSHWTTFARRVAAACRRIRWGQTRTYGELAAICGSPRAARAVGQVMATNRYPLVVPCHRVLAAGGRLGGISAPSGLAMKRRLLALERPLPSDF